MTREITRHSISQDEEEAKEFGGPYWNNWKYSLLDYLHIENFPDGSVENVLHEWWCLRNRLVRNIIDNKQFDQLKHELFPEGGELSRILDEEPESVLARGVRYITERVKKIDLDDKKIRRF